ncbi:hypothetical protein CRE_06629 [Caenorhabditis remanei]|uniref:Uncharacterized protein n=1 Tax=Caenorhabditis remanei TaxID=31234 RepID=E3M1V2_CAERE|nr:hypothetical protein CRE_06629 [Caenorhabditis remanei]
MSSSDEKLRMYDPRPPSELMSPDNYEIPHEVKRSVSVSPPKMFKKAVFEPKVDKIHRFKTKSKKYSEIEPSTPKSGTKNRPAASDNPTEESAVVIIESKFLDSQSIPIDRMRKKRKSGSQLVHWPLAKKVHK